MQTKLELYRKVTPLVGLGIWERNLATGEIYWNLVMRQIYEVDEHYEPTLSNSLSFYNDKDAITELFETAVKTGEAGIGDFQITTAKNTLKWIEVNVKANFEDGVCTVLYGTLHDVSSKINMLHALQEREERFHQAFLYAPIGMALVSITGEWIRVNKSLCDMLGYRQEDLLKRSFQDITYPDDLENDLTQMQQVLNREIDTYSMEKRYFHSNGHIIWVLLSVSLIRSEEGEPLYFVSQIKDITDNKKHTDILLRERQRLDNIIKSTAVGPWEWRIDKKEAIWSTRAARLLGYELSELQPDLLQAWRDLIHPADIAGSEKMLQKCFNKEMKYYAAECRMKHKDGSWVWIESRGKVVEWSAGDKPLLMFGTFANINERKVQEQERKRTLEIISAQNSRLLNFAHIVSHNLRSHAGNIQMLLDMLTSEDDESEKKNLLNMLTINASNLQQTLTHLNEVVKLQEHGHSHKRAVYLREEVVRTLEILSELLRGVEAVVNIDIDDDIVVNYDAAYLESILLNLISNSVKYRKPGVAPRIDISARNSGDALVLEIQDNGQGIDMKLHGHKLFGMYKTFHGNSDARGIGLFMVKNQVEAMGGRITAYSDPGNGATFKVEII